MFVGWIWPVTRVRRVLRVEELQQWKETLAEEEKREEMEREEQERKAREEETGQPERTVQMNIFVC